MAAERYLIACACGHEAAVRPAAAGTSWECPQCRAELPLPSFRQLRQRPIVAEQAARTSPFQFSLASLFLLTLMTGIYLAAANHWGYWRVTFVSFAVLIYASIQGLLLYRGTRLVVYGNVLAFIATALLLPMPVWLQNQREQARRTQCHQNLRDLGAQHTERFMFFGNPRRDSPRAKKLWEELREEMVDGGEFSGD